MNTQIEHFKNLADTAERCINILHDDNATAHEKYKAWIDWGVIYNTPVPGEGEECPDCGGDGIETCNNPDHGFIDGIGGEIGRLGCPVCGHDPQFKVRKNKCEKCNGTGKIQSDLSTANTELQQLRQMLAEMPGEKWISVKDKLPEELETIIFCTGMGYVSQGYNTGLKTKDGILIWHETYVGNHYHNITNWMPLPESPKQSENNQQTTDK